MMYVHSMQYATIQTILYIMYIMYVHNLSHTIDHKFLICILNYNMYF